MSVLDEMAKSMLLATYVVVELVPGEGERIGAVLGVEETVVGVLVTGDADGGEVVVVNPDLCRGVDVNEILALRSPEEFD